MSDLLGHFMIVVPQITAERDKYLSQRDKLLAALVFVAKVEQSHCYETDPEVNDLMQTRHDLRKCGDTARKAIEEVGETDGR